MEKAFIKNLQIIVGTILNKKNDFYKERYKASGIKKGFISSLNEETLHQLPVITLKELALSPFKKRRIEEKPGFNKLVLSTEADRYFIIHRSLEEIKKDSLPLEGTRPLVLFQDVYEALEHCLFFYEQGILPLIGEVGNPAIVYASAKQYNVDSVYLDNQCLKSLLDELLKLNLPIKSITLIDSYINSTYNWPKGITVHYILSLPEFGRIAYACPKTINKKPFVFHPFSDTYIEPSKLSILTSSRLHACPMIRYRSPFSFKETKATCTCNRSSFILSK